MTQAFTWRGEPPDPLSSGYHWLRVRGQKQATPYYWHAETQSWGAGKSAVSAEMIFKTHDYVDKITWATVWEVPNNKTSIV